MDGAGRTGGEASVVAFVSVGHAFAHLVMLLYPTVVLALEDHLGLGYEHLLPLAFPGYVLFGLGSLPAGWAGDRWSTSGMMSVYFLGTGAAVVLTGLAQGPVMLAIALTLVGLFASIYHPVAIAWLVGASERPGRALGVNGVWGAVGTAAAALIAGVLTDLVHWRAAFLVPGFAMLACGSVFGVRVLQGRLVMERRSLAPRMAGGPEYAHVRRDLVVLFFAMVLTGTLYQMMAVGLPKIFQVRLEPLVGQGVMSVGALVSLVYLVSSLGQIAGGLLADSRDERDLYAISYLVQAGVMALAALTHNILIVVVTALVVTLGTGTQPIENCLLARYTPERWRATVFGMKFVLSLGVSALGVPVIALSYGATGDFVLLFVLMCCLAILVVLLGRLLPPTDPRRRQPLAPATAS